MSSLSARKFLSPKNLNIKISLVYNNKSDSDLVWQVQLIRVNG